MKSKKWYWSARPLLVCELFMEGLLFGDCSLRICGALEASIRTISSIWLESDRLSLLQSSWHNVLSLDKNIDFDWFSIICLTVSL